MRGRACFTASARTRRRCASRRHSGRRKRAIARARWPSGTRCAPRTIRPDNALDRIEAIAATGDYALAARKLSAIRGTLDADPVSAARARMLAEDLTVLRGGAASYDAVASLPLDEPTARLATVKREIAHWPPSETRTTLLAILAAAGGTRDLALDLVTLQRLADDHPDRAIVHYLLGRQLYARGRFAEAAAELARAPAGSLPDARFTREAARVRGAALLRAGRRREARALFVTLADDATASEGLRLEARQWIARCDFQRP